MPPSDAAATTLRLATPRGADTDLSSALAPGLASTLGMFLPAVSSGVESAGEPGPSTATVDSDAARVTKLNRGNPSRHVQEAHQESTGSSSMHPLRREELILDSMRKNTLANLETKTLKAFRNIFAHHTSMRMRRFRIGCPIFQSSFTLKCVREFVVSSIQKPTRSDSR